MPRIRASLTNICIEKNHTLITLKKLQLNAICLYLISTLKIFFIKAYNMKQT